MKLSEINAAWDRFSSEDPDVLLKVGNDWVEVCAVAIVPNVRNGMTLVVQNQNLGGRVIVVDPDMTPLNKDDKEIKRAQAFARAWTGGG